MVARGVPYDRPDAELQEQRLAKVVHLKRLGRTHKEIAAAMLLGTATVNRYAGRARERGMLPPLPPARRRPQRPGR